MAQDVKIPSKDFCQQEQKSKWQLYRLFEKYSGLKCKVRGEKGYRVNMTRWERIKQAS